MGQLADGIDVKSATGYVVAPPSLHISGRRYEWLATGPITPAPGYLVPLLTRPVRVATGGGRGRMTKRRMAGLVRLVASAPVGQRNRRLYWACCRVHEAGGDVGPLIEAAVSIGYARRAAEATAASAARTAGVA